MKFPIKDFFSKCDQIRRKQCQIFVLISHQVKIFFYKMTRFREILRFTINFVFSRIQLQPSKRVMAFVVSDIVLLCVCNASEAAVRRSSSK